MPQPLSADDRFAVIEVIQRYAHACDSGEFALFDDTFTADAELDYRSAGGPLGGRDALRAWLAKSRSGLLMWQHLLSPPALEARGDAVHARTDVYTPNLFRGAADQVGILHTGGRYHDELIATSRGWRIRRRRYENVWVHGIGAGDAIPDPLKGARGPS
jgi:hypothetical protein